MNDKTDILDRITPEEIEAWLLAKREMEGLSALSPHCLSHGNKSALSAHSLNYGNKAWIYWSLHTTSLCVHGETFGEALTVLRHQEQEPKERLIRERREHAARLLAEADDMERGDA
jgi:hypothetical protein